MAKINLKLVFFLIWIFHLILWLRRCTNINMRYDSPFVLTLYVNYEVSFFFFKLCIAVSITLWRLVNQYVCLLNCRFSLKIYRFSPKVKRMGVYPWQLLTFDECVLSYRTMVDCNFFPYSSIHIIFYCPLGCLASLPVEYDNNIHFTW